MLVGEDVWIKQTQLTATPASAINRAIPQQAVSMPLWIPGKINSKENSKPGYLKYAATDMSGTEYTFEMREGEEESDMAKKRSVNTEYNITNLIDMPNINEPEALAYLEGRFRNQLIYTYTGPVLVAINPGGSVEPDDSCEDLFIDFIKNIKSISKSYAPVGNNRKVIAHTIIISGESGSGKTECTRVLLKSLLESTEDSGLMSGKDAQRADDEEELILNLMKAGSILETFGNAHIPHSNNSSRFGRLVNLEFNEIGNLVGGNIQLYLLENVRVIKQQRGERNFHIFYRLLAGVKADDATSWTIEKNKVYRYLNFVGKTSSSVGAISASASSPNITLDAEDYRNVVESMLSLGFSRDKVQLIMQTLVGVLHLGEIEFEAYTENYVEGSRIVNPINPTSNESISQLVGRLLTVSAEALEGALMSRTISSRGDVLTMRLTQKQASNGRDSLAKAIYRKVFEWIGKQVNHLLKVSGEQLGTSKNEKKVHSIMGILDIFGFDAFDINTFEQLCINYANETLQQLFNQTIFTLELEEYRKEGIPFANIEYSDNQTSVELIVNIFKILDDQCRLSNSTDKRFLSQLVKEMQGKSRFISNQTHQVKGQFSVTHFAGPVIYCVDEFVEKNMDELAPDAVKLLEKSENPIFGNPSANKDVESNGDATGEKEKNGDTPSRAMPRRTSMQRNAPTAIDQFRTELNALIKLIGVTSQHYIRCVNPVGKGQARKNGKTVVFNQKEVANQLKYGGIIQAMQVARSGFSAKYKYDEFLARYTLLLPITDPSMASLKASSPIDPKQKCEILVNRLADLKDRPYTHGHYQALYAKFCEQHKFHLHIDRNGFQFGDSKIFIRKTEYLDIELLRSFIVNTCGRMITRFMYQKLFNKGPFYSDYRKKLVTIQAFLRMAKERKRYYQQKSVRKNQQSTSVMLEKLTGENFLNSAQSSPMGMSPSPVSRMLSPMNSMALNTQMSLNLTGKVKLQVSNVTNEKGKTMEFLGITEIDSPVTPVLGEKGMVKVDSMTSKEMMNDKELRRSYSMNDMAKGKSTDEKDGKQPQQGRSHKGLLGRRESWLGSNFSMVDSVTGKEIPQDILIVGRLAKKARSVKNTAGRVSEYKRLDEKLLKEINELIAAKKVSDEMALLRFDIPRAKVLLMEWSQALDGELLDRTRDLAEAMDYGYCLLLEEKLVPSSVVSKMFGIGRTNKPGDKKGAGGNGASASITKEHKVFKRIVAIMEKIKEFIERAQAARKQVDGKMKQPAANVISIKRESLPTVSKLIEFCRILHQYYYQYILHFVSDYGEGSSYKLGFTDQNKYLKELSRLISLKEPLLKAEQLIQAGSVEKGGGLLRKNSSSRNQTQDGMFPLTLSVDALNPDAANQYKDLNRSGSGTNVLESRDKVVFRLIHCGPGIEYSLNCLLTMLQQEVVMYPIRFIKLVGKSALNYGQIAYYQAATEFSGITLSNVIQDAADYQLIDKKSYSAVFMCSLLAGALHSMPQNLMVKPLIPDVEVDMKKYPNGLMKVTGFINNAGFCPQLFTEASKGTTSDSTSASSQQMVSNHSQLPRLGNILFTCPQLLEEIDSSLRSYLLSYPAIAAEVVSSWIRELYRQNVRYNCLIDSGFTEDDLHKLMVPISLPRNSALRIYKALENIIKLLKTNQSVTHFDLLNAMYPEMAANYYQLIMQAKQDATKEKNSSPSQMLSKLFVQSSSSATPTATDATTISRIELLEYTSSLDDAALEFLRTIDFKDFVDDDSVNACAQIGDNLSFVPELWLRNVDEEQLAVMFGVVLHMAYKTKLQRQENFGAKLFTKGIVFMGLTDEERQEIYNSPVVKRIEELLGMKIWFYDEKTDRKFEEVRPDSSVYDMNEIPLVKAVPI